MITIDEDLGIEWRDAGPFRSFNLSAQGETLSEMLEDATISEIDQDGGELDCYGLEDAPKDVEDAAFNLILKQFTKEAP